MKNVCPTTHPSNISHMRMIFDWHEGQAESIPKLNSVKRISSHVEKDSEQARGRNVAECRRYYNGQSDQQIYEKGGDTLICVRQFGHLYYSLFSFTNLIFSCFYLQTTLLKLNLLITL